jgi:RNA 2',3'-cyclic 3'-phosphodiesterase
MNTLRLFLALELNNVIWSQLEYVVQYLNSCDLPSVRWVPVRNTHLTLKFLGDVPEERLPSLKLLITKVATQHNPFYMVSSGLGAFPSLRQPRILWAGIAAPDELYNLQKALETETRRLSYPVESRPFSAHLTLGRVAENIQGPEIGRITQALNGIDARDLGTVLVQSIHLYKSDLHPSGSIYTSIAQAPLLGQGPQS